jgi:PAS domain S-box-containing protein
MKENFDILIIDDSVELTLSLGDVLKENGFGTAIAPDRETAIRICRERAFGLALIDIKLPDANGLELVEELSGLIPDMEFIIITGYGTMEIAIEAVKKKKIVSFEMKPLDLNRFLLLIRQIHERKRASEALHLSEKRFQIFAESATDAIISIDEEGKIFYLNPEFETIFGYRNHEVIGKPITFLMNSKDNQNSKDAISDILKSTVIKENKRIEAQGYHKYGKIIPLEISFGGFSTKEGKFYTAIVRDITDRKVAENNLQRKLLIEKIVSAISARLVGIADFDQAIYDSLKEICIYSKARTAFILIKNKASKVIDQIYAWSDQGEISVLYEQNDNIHFLYEWFFKELEVKRDLLIPDTTKLPDDLEKYGSLLQNFGIRSLLILPIMGNEGVIGCLGLDNIENPGRWTIEEFNLLITLSKLFSSSFHRKSVEQDLIESEEIHSILLDATKEGIMIINPHGRITEVSNIILEIFKASSKEEFTGRRFIEFIPAELRKQKKVYFSDKVRKGITHTIELTLVRNDNTNFAAEVNISLLKKGMKETKGYLVVIRDISERKRMDKQLIHTERMAGIGVMAAGMAHEINQPLNTISLTMDNLMLSLNNGSTDKAYVENKTTKIFENITRIRNIIDHVRAFSKDHDDYIQSKFNINESIRNAKSMISEQFKHKGIHFVMNLDGTIPQLVGNTYKFEQVIVNLIINAKDAIEEKQTILNQDFNKVLEITSSHTDQYVYVEVKDNGIGIDPKNIDKVMLPFYSTKKDGVGTGLGLSISFGIISDMNGTIEIQSERYKGTTIRIRIPLKKEKKKHSEKE